MADSISEKKWGEEWGEREICYYCKNNLSDEGSEYIKKMYYIHNRMKLWVGCNYSEEKVYIPRCKECSDKHSDFGRWWFLIIMITVLALFIWFFLQCAPEGEEPFPIFGLIIILVVIALPTAGFIWHIFVDIFFTKKTGIPVDSEIEDYYIIKEMLARGWITSRPDAASHPTTSEEIAEKKKQESK